VNDHIEALQKLIEQHDSGLRYFYADITADRVRAALKYVRELEAERDRLLKMKVHCDRCGADYAETGLSTGCPCLIAAELDRLGTIAVTAWQHFDDFNDAESIAAQRVCEFIRKSIRKKSEEVQGE